MDILKGINMIKHKETKEILKQRWEWQLGLCDT